MPAYLVELAADEGGRGSLRNGHNAQVVFAADAAGAKELAAAYYIGDTGAWDTSGTTATEIAVDADWDGWTFSVTVHGGTGAGGDEPATVTVTGDSTDNTIDEVAALLVTALNGVTGIANAAYDGSTNTLTIAGAGDSLGDQKVTVEATPPNVVGSISGIFGTLTDEGSSGDALTVVLPADDAVIPAWYATCKT